MNLAPRPELKEGRETYLPLEGERLVQRLYAMKFCCCCCGFMHRAYCGCNGSLHKHDSLPSENELKASVSFYSPFRLARLMGIRTLP